MEDRRKSERRKLFGQRFLAMLIGVLPEDRRKAERRRDAAPAVDDQRLPDGRDGDAPSS